MRNPLLVPDLRELIQAGETAALREFFADHHPARVAEIIEDLGPSEGDTAFGLLPARSRADILSYFDSEHQGKVVEAMSPAEAAALLHLMSHDERADLVNRLDEDRVDLILPHLAQAERDDIRRLASYEPGTAGAVMTTDYVTLPPTSRSARPWTGSATRPPTARRSITATSSTPSAGSSASSRSRA